MEKIFLKLLLVFLVGGFLPVAQGALKVNIPFGTPVFGVLDERVTSGGKLHKDERRPGEPKKIAPSRVGKIVRAHVWKDVVVNGFTVIKAGAPMVGRVSRVTKPKIAGRGGKLEVAAVTATAVDGTQISLEGGYDNSGHSRVVSTAVMAGLLLWPLIFIKGKAAVLNPGTLFDATTRVPQQVAIGENQSPLVSIQIDPLLEVEILYDKLGSEKKPKDLPLQITRCEGALEKSEVIMVNEKKIKPIPIELSDLQKEEDCWKAQGLVSLKALGKHFQKGINRFHVQVEDLSKEVMLQVEM